MGESLAGVGYKFSIVETHHITKLDKPSGTAISIAEMVERGAGSKIEVPIDSVREGDAKGTHVLQAVSEVDRVVLTHEAFSRRGLAEGSVRAAEFAGDAHRVLRLQGRLHAAIQAPKGSAGVRSEAWTEGVAHLVGVMAARRRLGRRPQRN